MGSYIRGNSPRLYLLFCSSGALSHDIEINLSPSRLPTFVPTSIVREMFADNLYGITLYTIVDLRFMTFSAKVNLMFLFRPVPYVQKI